MSSPSSTAPAGAAPSTSDIPEGPGSAQEATGISLVAFVTALAASLVVFGIQMGFFLLLRNKLVRILCALPTALTFFAS
jgi:calcium permeable stress-gated cation channel